MATELRSRRKGKVKTNVFYKGKDHEAHLSHVKVQITASRKNIYLVLVYGITEHPMMLATNKEIKSKDDVIRLSYWSTPEEAFEEYKRHKRADILIMADKYKNKVPKKVYDALLRFEVRPYVEE